MNTLLRSAALLSLLPALLVDARLAMANATTDVALRAAEAAPPAALVSAEEAVLAPSGSGVSTVGAAVSMSADGSRVLIGDPSANNGASAGAGFAYVYRRTGATWALEATLSPAIVAAADAFGTSVALSGDGLTAIVGTPLGAVRADTGSGFAVVFTYSGGRWREQSRLRGAGGERFGTSVSINGDGTRALVGSPYADTATGSATVFELVGTAWVSRRVLLASDGARGDGLGSAVALSADGDTAIVGVPGDVGADGDGTARIFRFALGAWSESETLGLGAAAGATDDFGGAVAINGDGTRVVIGAALAEPYGPVNTGGAWVFVRDAAGWRMETLLPAMALASGDSFGNAVSISADGTRALVASFRDDTDSGSVRLYERTTAWRESGLLAPSAIEARDYFGDAVALSGDGTRAAVGVTSDRPPSGASDAGTVRIFTVTQTLELGVACGATDVCASGFCVDGVCCNNACGGGAADCRACSVAAGAAVNGTCAPRARDTVCRASAGVCDAAEVCNGTAVSCPADALAPSTTTCRASMGACDVAERCTGSSVTCPADGFAVDGSACADGMICNGEETCRAGMCEPGLTLSCDDGDPCTDDICAEPTGCTRTLVCMDAGVEVDAGMELPDAAMELADAGAAPDAHLAADASVPADSSVPADATTDASSANDAGGNPMIASGCGCRASTRSGGLAGAMLGLGFALALRVRRTRRGMARR